MLDRNITSQFFKDPPPLLKSKVKLLLLLAMVLQASKQVGPPTPCTVGEIVSPQNQDVAVQYTLNGVHVSNIIGPFTSPIAECSNSFNYQISEIKDNGQQPYTSATVPITISGSQLYVGPSIISDFVTQSPFAVKVQATCSANTCIEYQTFKVSFVDAANPCSSAPLSISALGDTKSVSMTVTDDSKTFQMTSFNYDTALQSQCYIFTTYQSDEITTPMTPPIPIAIAYPTVTLPATTANAIGNVPQIVYIAKVKATIPLQPSVVFWGVLQVTIKHECSLATFSATMPTIQGIYIIATLPNDQQSLPIGAFPISIAACTKSFSLVDSTKSSPLLSSLPFALDTSKTNVLMGPTTEFSLAGNYKIYVKAQINNGENIDYQLFDLTLESQTSSNCGHATLSLDGLGEHSTIYVIGSPQQVDNMNLFTFDNTNFGGCYMFTNYESDLTTTPIEPPIPMSIISHTLTIPQAAAGSFALAQQVYVIKVKGEIVNFPSPVVWATVTVTINNECSIASITQSPSAISTSYTVLALPQAASQQISVPIGTFTVSNPACLLSYQLTDSTHNPLTTQPLQISGNSLLIGPSQDTALINVSPMSLQIVAKIELGTGYVIVPVSITFLGADPCTLVTISTLVAQTITTRVLDPESTHTMNMFQSNVSTDPSCYKFTYYEEDGSTTPINSLIPMIIDFPTLTRPKISAGGIGTQVQLIYTIKIKAEIPIQSVVVWGELIQIVNHECQYAGLSASGNPVMQSYQLMSPATNVSMISAFNQNITNLPSGASCFIYESYYYDANEAQIIMPPYFSFSKTDLILYLAQTGPGMIDIQASKTHEFYIKGSINMAGSSMVISSLISIEILNECTYAVIEYNFPHPSLQYTIINLSPLQIIDLSDYFVLQGAPDGSNCYKYSLISQQVNSVMEPFIQTNDHISIVSTTQKDTVTTSVETFQLLVETQIAGLTTNCSVELTFELKHECWGTNVFVPQTTYQYTHKINDGNITIDLSPLIIVTDLVNGLNCIQFEMRNTGDTIPYDMPQYMILNNYDLILSPKPGDIYMNQAYTHDMYYRAFNAIQNISYGLQVSITFEHECLNAQIIAPSKQILYYTLDSPRTTFQLPKFSPSYCETSNSLSFANFTTIENNTVFFYASNEFAINKTSDNQYLGTHKFIISGQNLMNPNSTAYFEFEVIISKPVINTKMAVIPNKGAPYFVTKPQSLISVSLGDSFAVKLPKINDPDEEDAVPSVSIDWGLASHLVDGKYPTFIINPSVKESSIGTFDVKIVLSDNHMPTPLFSYYSFTLKISDPNGLLKVIPNPQVSQNNSTIVDNLASTSDQDVKKMMKEQKEKGAAYIKSIDHQGKVVVKFNKNIFVPDDINEIKDKIIGIKIEPGKGSDPDRLQIKNWTILEISKSQMIFRVQFEMPIRISYNKINKDRLVVLFLSNDLFDMRRILTSKPLSPKLVALIPRQMEVDESTLLAENVKTVAKQTSTVVIASTMAVNVAMSVSLQLLWALVNVMQLLLIMPLINVNFPVNAATFYGYLIDIANFDVIPTDQINSGIYNFTDLGIEMPSNFEELGYETPNFINNMGSMIIFIKAFFFMSLFTCILKLCTSRFKIVEKLHNKLELYLFYNFILRLIIESYLEIVMSSILHIQNLTWTSGSDCFASGLSLLFFATALVYPFAVWVLLWCKPLNVFKEETFESKFGSLYDSISTTRHAPLLFSVLFMLRRLLFAVLALFFQEYPFLQLHLTLVSTLAMLIYLISVRPFEDSMLNKLEIFNELCVLGSVYHMYAYTDYVPEVETQYKVGYSMIALTVFNIAANIMVVVVCTILELIKKIKRSKYCKFKLLNNKDGVVAVKPSIQEDNKMILNTSQNLFKRPDDHFEISLAQRSLMLLKQKHQKQLLVELDQKQESDSLFLDTGFLGNSVSQQAPSQSVIKTSPIKKVFDRKEALRRINMTLRQRQQEDADE